MLDLYSPLKHVFTQIKQKIPSLSTIEQKSFSFLKIMAILLTISFMIIVAFWIFDKDEAIVVQPFETVGLEKDLDGKSLATLLSFDLQKIKNTYGTVSKITVKPKNSGGNMIIPRPLEEFCITNLSIKNAPGTPLEYSISQIGTVGVQGTSISIGNLLLSIKEFLGNKGNVITCSLQRYNSSIIAVAILEDHYFSKGDIITIEYDANISKEEQIPSLVNDLAFMIALELSKQRAQGEDDLYPQAWQTFKYVTQGRDAYNNYVAMKDINYLDKVYYLDKGRNMALSAIKFEPGYEGSFELLSCLGFAYLEMERYDEATKIFKNITEFKPFESALGLGLIYGKQGRYAEALNALNDAVQLNPRSADAWNYKGVILSKQGNYSEAVKAFRNTTRLSPQYATAWKYEGDALAHLGRKENNRSRYNEAIQAYDKAIDLDPQYASAWNNKGIMLYNLGKYSEATRAYEETIKLNSSNAAVWYEKGLSLLAMGKNDEALTAYDKVIQIDPGNRTAWIYKAIALERLNRHNESVKSSQKALSIKNESLNADSKNGSL